jgi:hypothetical protein
MEEEYQRFLKGNQNKIYKILLGLDPEEYLKFIAEDFETYRKIAKREWKGLTATLYKDSVYETVKF